MKNVLVVGGAGYIGSHTCKAMAKIGMKPVVLDNLVYGHRESVKWGPFYEGDLFDRELVSKIIDQEKIEAVIHFAAFAYVGESVKEPLKYYRNNTAGTIALLDACLAKNVNRIVFSSTCASYGIPASSPIDETFPQNPINPYGQSKLMVEKILKDLCHATETRAVVLRYFNAAGADPEAEIGEDHDPETHLIPLVLQAAADPSKPVTVFGQDYPTADGTCVRDYIHVNDLASAHILALQKMDSLPERYSVFNLGTQNGYSVAEVLREAEKVVGHPIPHKFGERRPGDPPALVATSRRAREILGWDPKHSDLATILGTAWGWYRKRFGSPSK